nr:hypothetical protein [uncultured bacterium]
MNQRIAVVPGDGIGPEVVDEAMLTMDCLGLGFEFDVLDHVNAGSFLRRGATLSEQDMDRIRAAGTVLFGAVGDPRVTSPDYARGVLLRLRFELDLYVNLRPVWTIQHRLSPLRDPGSRVLDCVIVRENTEGLYAGMGGVLRPGTPHEVAIDQEINTWHGVTRVMDYAFSVARREVCLVDKANAVPNGGQLWQRCWRATAGRHPGIETSHLYADIAAAKLVEDPSRFDVIVTNNSYGDILSDLAAALVGGMGVAASANINPDTGQGLYEPVHGSAPDIAGRSLANPAGAVLSAALLIENLGHQAEAQIIRQAVGAAVAAGRCTPDLGGNLTTKEAGAAIRAELDAGPKTHGSKDHVPSGAIDS